MMRCVKKEGGGKMPGHVRERGRRKDGSTRWQARWRGPAGQSVRREQMFRTKRDAKRWIVQMESSVFQGDFIDPRKGERPFSDVIEVWKRRWVNLEPKTKAGYEQIINRHLLPRFGRRKVASITHEVVQDYIHELSGSGLAPGTVRGVYAALLLALAEAIDPRYRTLIYTAAYTGLRWGELCALRVRDLKLARLEVNEALKE